jgi:hypothetical protein
VHHSYFGDRSLSTIKRAVAELKDNELLLATNKDYISDDKRVVWLTVNENK